jgi:hypothetical protein
MIWRISFFELVDEVLRFSMFFIGFMMKLLVVFVGSLEVGAIVGSLILVP